MIKDHPITGIGFGMQSYDDMNLLMYYYKKFPVDDRPTRSNIFLSPHNLLLDITVRLGMVGLLLFGFLIFRFLRMGWQTIRRGKDDFIRGWGSCIMACFIAFFVQALFSDAGFGIQAIVMYTIFAMMTILWQLQHSPSIRQDEQTNPAMSTQEI
jgi:O-antigen ligase